MEPEERVSESRGREHSLCAFPALVCALRLISRPQHLERDRKGMKREEIGARRPTMQFRVSRTEGQEKTLENMNYYKRLLSKYQDWEGALRSLQ